MVAQTGLTVGMGKLVLIETRTTAPGSAGDLYFPSQSVSNPNFLVAVVYNNTTSAKSLAVGSLGALTFHVIG